MLIFYFKQFTYFSPYRALRTTFISWILSQYSVENYRSKAFKV